VVIFGLSLPLIDTIRAVLTTSAAATADKMSTLLFILIESPPLLVHPIELSLQYDKSVYLMGRRILRCLTVTIRVRHRCLTANNSKTPGKQAQFLVRKKRDRPLS
jgi:hypothetical protein